MIRYLSATTAVAVLFALPAVAETRTYDVGAFDRISVSSGIEVHVTAGRSQSVTVEERNGKFDDIGIDVVDGQLQIHRLKRMNWGRHRNHYEVTVDIPALKELKASSGSEIKATDIDATDFAIRVSSGAEINAAGRCTTLTIRASSGADTDARDLQCNTVTGHVSSGASIDAYGSNSVEASASSGGSLRVFGGATDVDISKSSGGSVQVRR